MSDFREYSQLNYLRQTRELYPYRGAQRDGKGPRGGTAQIPGMTGLSTFVPSTLKACTSDLGRFLSFRGG
jgi:hypothetical protein